MLPADSLEEVIFQNNKLEVAALVKCFGKSVAGMQRENNEDSIYVGGDNKEVKNIFIVADGMGGHNAGEVASRLAIDKFIEYISPHFKNGIDSETVLDVLLEGVVYANRVIYNEAVSDESRNGMGTTFTCACLNNGKMYAVHVGDSRIYILTDGSLKQVSNDHSFVMEMVRQGKLTPQEAANSPKRNIITRAVGSEEKIDVDTIIKELKYGDVVLICSDGLSTMVNDREIEEIMNKHSDAEKTIEALIEKANKNGGKDNISAIIIRNEVDTNA